MKQTFQNVATFLKNVDKKAKKFAIISVFFALLIYVHRTISDEIIEMGWGAGIVIILSCPFILAGFIWFIVHVISMIKYCFRPTNSRLFVIGTACVILLAYIVPEIPPREYYFFRSHQDEYEEMVQVALSGQVSHRGYCQASEVFATPRGFETLSDECVSIDFANHIVEAMPLFPYVSITYVESPDNLEDSYYCHIGGIVLLRIDPNWYICELDPV